MPGRPYILAETNWKTVKDTDYEIALLPWGATEAHNYHLPYATDVFEADYIAGESARHAWEHGAKVIALPSIPFGVNTGQFDIKLCINMNPGTQAAVLRDVVHSLSCAAISKVVILNSHGGNDFKQMIRELQPQFPKLLICQINWYHILKISDYFDTPDNHAGEMETSIILHTHPDLVLPLPEAGEGRERKFKIAGLRERWVWAQREWSKATEDTGVGNPAKATAEKGKAFLEALTQKIGSFLVELAESDIEDLYERE